MIAIDIETHDPLLRTMGPGVYRKDSHILGVGIVSDDGFKQYFSLGHEQTTLEDRNKNRAKIQELIGTSEPKVFASAQYDLDHLINGYGFRIGGEWHDILLAEPLLDEYLDSYSLDSLAQRYLGEKKQNNEIEELARLKGLKGDARAHLALMPAEMVGRYCVDDARQTLAIAKIQYGLLTDQELLPVYKMEIGLLPLLLQMRKVGIRVDEQRRIDAVRALQDEKLRLKTILYAKFGEFNFNASGQLAEVVRALGQEVPKTDKGNASIKNEYLDALAARGVPYAHQIVQLRKLDKIIGTFMDGAFREFQVDGRIHAQFVQMASDEGGTVTGRFSCLSGDTILTTTDGICCLKDFEPGDGTKILTHTGRLQKVVRKFDQGIRQCYRLTTNKGTSIICTSDHKFLTPQGWKEVKSLQVGSEVLHVGIEKNDVRSRDSEEGSVGVPREPRQTNNQRGSYTYRGYFSYRGCNTAQTCSEGCLQGTDGSPIFQSNSEDGAVHDGKNRRKAPQLEGALFRQQRTLDSKVRGSTILHSQDSFRTSSRTSSFPTTPEVDSSPYRRESSEQQHRQFSFMYKEWARKTTPSVESIRSITAMGAVQVFDIEVENDHSFVVQGFISHNCKAPNLTQIPSRNGDEDEGDFPLGSICRSIFIPEEGCWMGKADLSQGEYRMLAHYALGPGSNELRQSYIDNPKMDYHTRTAQLSGLERKSAKNLTFGINYGMGIGKMMTKYGWDEKRAYELRDAYYCGLPFLIPTRQKVELVARARGYIKTIYGRRERVSAEIREKNKYYVFLNRLMQGSVADLNKKGMHDAYKAGIFNVLYPHLTVHDELVQSVPKTKEGIEAYRELKHIMETCISGIKVPIIAEAEYGPSYGETTKITDFDTLYKEI